MRALSVLLGVGLLAAPHGVSAVEVDAEDIRRLADRVNSHDEALDTYRITLQEMRNEIVRLRAENDRLKTQLATPRNYVTQEQLSKLADQVREVETKRAADKQQILDAIDKLKAMPPVVVPPPDTGRAKPSGGGKPVVKDGPATTGGAAGAGTKPPAPEPEPFSEYFEHTVAEGETLSAILDAYNKQHGLKTRLTHVLKANPSLKDPKKMRLGQKIRIPAVR